MTVKAKASNRIADVVSKPKSTSQNVTISAPNFVSTELTIAGTARQGMAGSASPGKACRGSVRLGTVWQTGRA